jgi:hydrogenase nickel incorporation protein HypB
MRIPVNQRILAANETLAEELRARFQATGLFVINIMGSPGAGKTSLVEQTLEHAGDLRIGVIEGDLATSLDAERISKHGARAVQINTGGACHLDAQMIRKALPSFDLPSLDILIIENVGNLVCPVNFDLGESQRVIVCSLPEGDDKILKYPATFVSASAVVLNKMDLLGLVPFDLERFRDSFGDLNLGVPLFEVSCTTDEGMGRWMEWLTRR